MEQPITKEQVEEYYKLKLNVSTLPTPIKDAISSFAEDEQGIFNLALILFPDKEREYLTLAEIRDSIRAVTLGYIARYTSIVSRL
jgi:hypothetical protein